MTASESDDIEYLKNPSDWLGQEEKREKICLMINVSNGKKVGFVVSVMGEVPTSVILKDEFTNKILGKEDFKSVEEMVASGWAVDFQF